MTTAARPTFNCAQGGMQRGEKDLSALSKQYSSRDLPSHLKLKYRKPGQGTTEELKKKDFKKDLELREKEHQWKKNNSRSRETTSSRSLAKKPRLEAIEPSNPDADLPINDEEDESEDDSEDNDEDLMEELNRIKKERAIEEKMREEERIAQENKVRAENLFMGNPLTQKKGDFRVKRRWDDDVVFKNCARGDDDKKEKAFINDTLRSEFHKKFMDKYVK